MACKEDNNRIRFHKNPQLRISLQKRNRKDAYMHTCICSGDHTDEYGNNYGNSYDNSYIDEPNDHRHTNDYADDHTNDYTDAVDWHD